MGQLPYSTNNEAILDVWNAIFKQNSVSKKNLICAVLDGGGNFQKAGRAFTSESSAFTHWCACHRLHLVTKCLFKKGPSILKKIHEKANEIASKIARSYQFSFTLKTQQQKLNLSKSVTQATAIRWNSSFEMITSLVLNKEAIKETIKMENLDNLSLNENEWYIMEFLSQWCEPITKSIIVLQADSKATIDLVLVQLAILHFEAEKLLNAKPIRDQVNAHEVVNFKKSLGKALQGALNTYFPKEERLYGASSKKRFHLLVRDSIKNKELLLRI